MRSFILMLLVLGLQAAEITPVFLDLSRSIPERVTDYLSRLTLEQKAQLLDKSGPDVTVADFTLRSDKWNQCLNGVRWMPSHKQQYLAAYAVRSGTADADAVTTTTTLFPTCIALGATWDPALVKTVAGVLSDEARAIYNGWHLDPQARGEHKGLIYRAPVIEVSRNPFWGRIHEVYSEDTYLTGRMGVAYVQGLQGDDARYLKLAATLKHFVVNNVESHRTKLDAAVPERWLREYYLPHFRDAVVEGEAQSLMASYNAINGQPNNINRWLLTELIKEEWKHAGFVVSDLGGIKSMVEGHKANGMTYEDAVAQSVIAGCDFSDKEYRENIVGAVTHGKLPVSRLDDAVRRVITVRMRLGEFDPWDKQPWSDLKPAIINSPAHHAVALKAAQASIVLLKNDRGLLPLNPAALKSVAVIGPLADRVILNNYSGIVRDVVTPLAGLRNRLGSAIEVRYALGGLLAEKDHKQVNSCPPLGPIDSVAERTRAVAAARGADVAILFVGTNAAIEQEGRDRKDLALPGDQQALVEAVVAANPRTIVVQLSAGPLATTWIKANVPAVLHAWWPGQEGGNAIADVVLGAVNPAGRLPYTVYADLAQVPPVSEYDLSKGFTYQYLRGAPLYAFGFGLSYTSFAYRSVALSAPTAKVGDTLIVSATIANTGARAGDEVVQVYVKEPAGSVPKPAIRLVGFARVNLDVGDQKTISIPVEVARMRYWDEVSHAFKADPGVYGILVGGSSDALTQKATFTLSP